MKRVVVDSNILFSALISHHSRLREILLSDSDFTFFCPKFLFVELFKHKEKITAATQLDEEELLETLNTLLARFHFVDESTIQIGTWIEARRLCSNIDEKDTPFIALTIHLDAALWSADEELKDGLRGKGFDRFYSFPKQ
jgi:predicted nucleic acid-binding protein